jgi:hypothetical protein
MKTTRVLVLMLLSILLHGCVLTKVATVPMRIGGAAVSVVPLVGNPIDDTIDAAADTVDKVPI